MTIFFTKIVIFFKITPTFSVFFFLFWSKSFSLFHFVYCIHLFMGMPKLKWFRNNFLSMLRFNWNFFLNFFHPPWQETFQELHCTVCYPKLIPLSGKNLNHCPMRAKTETAVCEFTLGAITSYRMWFSHPIWCDYESFSSGLIRPHTFMFCLPHHHSKTRKYRPICPVQI